MNLVDFLCERECRTDEFEGFEIYSLQYRNRFFSIKRGEPDKDSIAFFYLCKDCDTTYDVKEPEEVFRGCFIQKEMYSHDETDTEGHEYIEDLLDMLSRSCRCADDCTMESGCILMQQLLSLKCRLNWKKDWAGQLLEAAESRVSDWIYGM